VSQASKEEEEIRMQNRDNFYMGILGQQRESRGMGRGPAMVYLKATIVWLYFYAEK
jgi:hypothetical protein